MMHRPANNPTGHAAHDAAGTPWQSQGGRLGSLIGGVFGLVYVELNVGSLPPPAPMALRAAGAAAFVVLLVLLARGRSHAPGGPGAAHERPGFGRRYWMVVAGEGAAIVGGAALLNGPLGRPGAVVAWVSVVVGIHFLPLGTMWAEPLFWVLGGAVAACGAAGLTAAALGATPAVVATLGGVLPGALLLGSAFWGVLRIGAAGAAIGGPAPRGPVT